MSRITSNTSTLAKVSTFGYDKRDQLTLGDHAVPAWMKVTLTTRMVFFHQPPYSGLLLADEQITATTSAVNVIWPLADHLGTIRDLLDFNEATSVFTIANHRVFESFGELTTDTNVDVRLTERLKSE